MGHDDGVASLNFEKRLKESFGLGRSNIWSVRSGVDVVVQKLEVWSACVHPVDQTMRIESYHVDDHGHKITICLERGLERRAPPRPPSQVSSPPRGDRAS